MPELMVVVTVIGVLAAIAIPNFQRFQRRAIAVEGKNALGNLYGAEKSFKALWEGYASDLTLVGFSVDGATRSNVGFGTVGAGDALQPTSIQATASLTYAARGSFSTTQQMCTSGGIWDKCDLRAGVAGWPTLPGGDMVNPATDAAGAFIAGSSTDVGSGIDEQWLMDDKKSFTQVQDGIN